MTKKLKNCKKDVCQSRYVPNKETKKSIKNIEEGKNLTKYDSVEDFFKKHGI